MLKRLFMVSTAVSALAFGVPGAHAEPASVDCGFNTVSQETATGGQDTFTGTAYGYLVSDTAGEIVSVSCEVRVDGSTVAATHPGFGTQGATTQGQVTYTASDTQDVDLCAVWTAGQTSGEVCADTTSTQLPPQEVVDLIDVVLGLVSDTSTVADPLVCPLLAGLSPGVPGVVDIYSDGDVALAGELFWDCPPYDSSGGGTDEGLAAGAVFLQNSGGLLRVLTTKNVECGPDGNGVKCSAKAGKPRCSSVAVTAELVPNLTSTVTGTVTCGTLSASATAGPTTSAAQSSENGSGRHPFECDMAMTGVAVLPRVTCSYVNA